MKSRRKIIEEEREIKNMGIFFQYIILHLLHPLSKAKARQKTARTVANDNIDNSMDFLRHCPNDKQRVVAL